ncbi:MAG: hypothetical protein JW753_07695 [Dehalococcoidia bacterium]|nr:hypothetical protein [Dehalococcoidia bacterium]
MPKERNDFSGPIGDRVPWEEFSEEFLSKIMALWQEQWETFAKGLVRVGSQMDGVGRQKAEELLARVKAEVDLPDFARAAEASARSKSDRLKVMRQWQEQWEAFTNGVVRVGAQMEGIGLLNGAELLARTMEEANPPIFAKMAEAAKVNVNTVEGRVKAGGLCMDNMADHYPGHYEVKSDSEVILRYNQCAVMDKNLVGGDNQHAPVYLPIRGAAVRHDHGQLSWTAQDQGRSLEDP